MNARQLTDQRKGPSHNHSQLFQIPSTSPQILSASLPLKWEKKMLPVAKGHTVRCDLSRCWRLCTQPTRLAANGHPEDPLHRYPLSANPSFDLPYSKYLTVWCLTWPSSQPKAARSLHPSMRAIMIDTQDFMPRYYSVPPHSPASRCQLPISVQVWKADWNDSRAEATDSGVV